MNSTTVDPQKNTFQNLQNYWLNALTFEEYMQEATERATNNNIENDPYQEYYELGLQRMNRTLKTFKLDSEQLQRAEAKNFEGKILIISEPWCGDASATVPAVSKFFEAMGNEVRVFLRDRDTSLIDQFLTNGTQSIPKVIVLDENFHVKSNWGPRPQYGNDLLKKFKENPETYPREDFYNDLQVYYSRNKGKDAIGEIITLL
ncbi:thioredoxin family protein [Kaistella daneshvariae]|uniref:Thioredoxin family protein n=1 Tax=Kaistella daneshvariae TaxID=2487074 RepID=A0ABM7C6S5_9FLAO|nr:thioredoxin family protein [Kaistella daneshvariae]AZI66677.1 thioredoxin family protein [Kaistella daneshvariae]